MKDYVYKRVIAVANYFLDTKKTVREVAVVFELSKSTIHKDLTERLLSINHEMYESVSKILEEHKNIRHIRGGLATKRKYKGTTNE